jgi:uncharacterized protein HemX
MEEAMGAAAVPLGLALSAVGTGFTIMQASQQASLARQRASQQQAAARFQNEQDRITRERRRQQTIGKQLARYGLAGIDTSSGTPIDLISDTAGQFAREQSVSDLNTSVYSASRELDSFAAQQDAQGRMGSALMGFGRDAAKSGVFDPLIDRILT